MTFTTNTTYAGFTLKKREFIKEIDSDVFLFEHELLKCPLIAIKNGEKSKHWDF